MFDIIAVAGSRETAGKNLSLIEWRLDGGRPKLPNLTILDTGAPNFVETIVNLGIGVAFSALPSSTTNRENYFLIFHFSLIVFT